MTIHCSRCGKVLYNEIAYRVTYYEFNLEMEVPVMTDRPSINVWRCPDCVPPIIKGGDHITAKDVEPDHDLGRRMK